MAVLLIAYSLGLLLRPRKNEAEIIDLQEISVVVPFRNESRNLAVLLNSMKALKTQPAEFIFVNDHSEDNFRGHFAQSDFQVLHLEPGQEGKKAALRAGISEARGKYILTWDADVELNPAYFERLQKIRASDLIILPVKMKSKNLAGLFATLDFYFLNALNVALSQIKKPIVAGGANLLFLKTIYLEMLAETNNQDIASGDDQFLLQYVKGKKGRIDLVCDEELTVNTAAPATFHDFLHQRLRWIGKTKQVKDTLANLIGVLGLVYHLSGILLVAFYPALYWVLLLKAACDVIVLLPYLFKLKHTLPLFFSPLFTLFYPLYLFFLAIAACIVTPTWKNRAVKQ
ncbi:MAG: glycosyltransferase [Bacteroidota bacterium]